MAVADASGTASGVMENLSPHSPLYKLTAAMEVADLYQLRAIRPAVTTSQRDAAQMPPPPAFPLRQNPSARWRRPP
jgi:hypothetical protein